MAGKVKLTEASYILKPGPWLDWNGVVRLLKRKAKAAGGLSKWAAAHKISYEYARLVLTSKRIPGPAITKALGLEKALMWRLPAGRAHLASSGKTSRSPRQMRCGPCSTNIG